MKRGSALFGAMRLALLALAALLVAAFAPLAPAAAPPTLPTVVAAGPAHHSYHHAVPGPTDCEADGAWTFLYDAFSHRVAYAGTGVPCAPEASTLTGCAMSAGGTVHCERDNGTEHVRVTLEADGTLTAYWADADFTELVTGSLTRV